MLGLVGRPGLRGDVAPGGLVRLEERGERAECELAVDAVADDACELGGDEGLIATRGDAELPHRHSRAIYAAASDTPVLNPDIELYKQRMAEMNQKMAEVVSQNKAMAERQGTEKGQREDVER